MIIIISPVLCAFIIILKHYMDKNKISKDNKIDDELGILVKMLPETVTTESPDRSSVVFENIFKKTVNEYLSGNTKKMVIVIDNLDRINEDFFLNMWQSLQTFLQFRSSFESNGDVLNRVWFIIPYDGQYLKSIKSDTFNPISFIEKSFQLRYEIPLNPFTDWADLAKKLIEQATENCSDWTDSDRENILKILTKTRENTGDVPTPRQIRLYINQVCLTKHLYPEISVSGIAYYVIHRYSFKENAQEFTCKPDSEEKILKSYVTNDDIIQKLIRGDIPEQSDLLIFDNPEQIVKELSALACGTSDLEKGTEILLYQPIYDAIYIYHDREALKNLKNVHKDAFWTVFSLVIKDNGLNFDVIKTIKSSIWEKDNPLLREFNSRIEAELKKEFGVNDPIYIWSPLLQIKKLSEDEKLDEMIRLSEPLVEICNEIGNEENKLTELLRENLLIFICHYMESDGANEERVKLFLRFMNEIDTEIAVKDVVQPKRINPSNLSFIFWATFSIVEKIPGFKWIIPESFNPGTLNIMANKINSCKGLHEMILYIRLCDIAVDWNKHISSEVYPLLPTDRDTNKICILASIFAGFDLSDDDRLTQKYGSFVRMWDGDKEMKYLCSKMSNDE